MDIDYSKFEIGVGVGFPAKQEPFFHWSFSVGRERIHGRKRYTTKRAAIRGAKRAIKRIVETAVGDK